MMNRKTLPDICNFHRLGNLIPAIIILMISTAVFAQNNHRIECLARVKQDTILLRWVPASIPVWQTGNKYGYNIHRYTIVRDGTPVPDGLTNGELLTPAPIRPLSKAAFENLTLRIPEAAIVQEAVYGDEFQMPDPAKGFTSFLKSYRELEMRFGFSLFVCDLSTDLAAAAGLFFTDTNVKPNERYAYRITPAFVPQGLEIEPGSVVVDAGKNDMIPIPADVIALFADKSATVRWPVMLHHGMFTAYILERSSDGKTFRPVSDLPLVTASNNDDPGYFIYRDSLDQNGLLTYYRVRGITPFGERSAPSEAVSGKGMADFDAYAVIDTTAVTGENKVLIGWRITEMNPGMVRQITVQRAPRYEGPYEDIARLKPAARTYTDDKATLTNYYRILLSGDGGLSSYSFARFVQLEDNDPPAPPVNIAGTVDSTGMVTLAWQANTEPDIKGYRVFRANASFEEFTEVSRYTITATTFRDTINLHTLTHEIWYQLVAVDLRYNNSGYSAPVKLTRPDTIAPAAAVFTSLQPSPDGVVLAWETSPSDDIANYTLYRKAAHDTIPVKIKDWNPSQATTPYTDRPQLGGTYTYTLTATDLSGNKTSHSRTCRYASADPMQVTLTVTYNSKSKQAALQWTTPPGLKPVQVTVYRGEPGNQLAVYRRIDSPATSYLDEEIEPGAQYLYCVRISFDNGQSTMSQEKTIKE